MEQELDIVMEANASMEIDVQGKLRNLKLPYYQGIVPVFEAIVNSIQAIQHTNKKDGKIDIEIWRDLSLFDQRTQVAGINKVRVSDNGCGFTQDNRKSFRKSDSTYKSEIGGKGVGRFFWLKVFEEAYVVSEFEENLMCYRYSFRFRAQENPIIDPKVEKIECGDKTTSVTLDVVRADYQKSLAISNDDLIFQIGGHILPYIIFEDAPQINLIEQHSDGTSTQKDLTGYFKRDYIAHSQKKEIKYKSNDFTINAFTVKKKVPRLYNTFNLCGDNRLATTEYIKEFIPDFSSTIFEETLGNNSVVVLITSKYLDDFVNHERSGFNIPSKKEDDLLGLSISTQEINSLAVDGIKEIFRVQLDKVREVKVERLTTLINSTLPQYRFILNRLPEFIDSIRLESEESIEQQLYKIKYELNIKTKKKVNEVLKRQRLTNADKYNDLFRETMDSLNDLSHSTLVEYVVHRRVIIELFEKIIEFGDRDKFEYEKQLHNLIFQMHVTSNEVEFDSQNLWLIDERLSYHRFLSSDLPLKAKGERPDLLIELYDKAVAYTTQKLEDLITSLVIVEFKRPGRDTFTLDDHPHHQVNNYIKLINEGKAKVRGRTINVSPECRFYCYIISDISKETRDDFINTYTYKPTPDGLGLFLWTDKKQIEVIPFAKLLSDSKQRNQILFDKANII